MPSARTRRFLAGTVCLLVAVSGCSGLAPTSQPTTTTVTPSTATEAPHPTASPTAEPSRGGLLIVAYLGNATDATGSDAVRYDPTVVERSPTLDDALREASATAETQRRDLSAAEGRRVESVADAYNASTGGVVVLRNDTAVHVEVAYEV
jgi:hypothetical protein